VYLALEYLGMDNSRLTVTTRDTTGEVVFRSERPYVGSGRDDVPMGYDGGWPAGEYVSEVAVDGGEPLAIVVWFVEPAPIAAVPYGPPRYFVPAPAVPVCRPPAGWYPHFVRAGDTLSALAARLGTSVFALRSANCLKTDAIFVGQTLYLPAPVPPAYTKPIRPYPTPRYATWGPPGDAPATEPPPISGPPPGAPVPGPWPTTAPKIGDPTLAPRPTLPPLPSTP
jgi:LysM repeat protein